MMRKIRTENPGSSPMVRGLVRHETLQIALCKAIRRVGDLKDGIQRGSNKVCEALREITAGCDPSTPVFVFKEVAVNRLKAQSRRADLVFYIPKVRLVTVEYKTVEDSRITGESTDLHERQLRETHQNLITNLTYKTSLPPFGTCEGKLLKVTTLLLTRRFWSGKKCDDVVVQYTSPTNTGIKERTDHTFLVNVLGRLGRCARYGGR